MRWGIIDSPILFLADTSIVLFTVVLVGTWKSYPFMALSLLAGMQNIDRSIYESAQIDGASPYQTYWKIVFPTAVPGMISVAVYTLMSVWNEFTIANIFIQSTELQTLSVGLRQFQLQTTTDWGALSAAAALACIPAFLFLIVVQKYLISGMTSGAVKG